MFGRPKNVETTTAPTTSTSGVSLQKTTGGVSLVKGQSVQLEKERHGAYTLLARWGKKDYDLYALVEYVDGHVEPVSCFGTTDRPNNFSTRTQDGAVVHVSGDQATSNHGGGSEPQEVIYITMNPQIKSIAMVVYSAKNSGTGSFRRYGVNSYLMTGHRQTIDTSAGVAVTSSQASSNDNVYTLVPAVIHNHPEGPVVDAVELYSRPSSELRPVLKDGHVTMDAGKENADKPRPTS